MGYSLKKPEHTVVKYAGGETITARPINAPVLAAARAVAQRQAREALENPDIIRDLGIGGDIEEKDAKAVTEALFVFFMKVELGVRLIESWDGFGDETAAIANADNIRAVFTLHPTVGEKFNDDVMEAYIKHAVIKKNSATSAAGTSSAEAAKDTATAAAN